MKKTIQIFAILAVVFGTAGACKSTENSGEQAQSAMEEKTAEETAAIPEGYVEGVIVHNKDQADCEYTITTTEGAKFDPINLEDSYKKEGAKVVFKFAGLRMPNRCLIANPIRIEEIRMK